MRIGAAFTDGVNAQYRAVDPLQAMSRRGHDVVWPARAGSLEARRFAGCDVVHVYRLAGEQVRREVKRLLDQGVAVTYDNDDDYTLVPKESPRYKTTGGVVGQRIFRETVKIARLAQTFTTTNEVLAARYREAGIESTAVVPNALGPDVERPQSRHDGIVVGWVAALEHLADVARVPIRDALERLVAAHADVRVQCVGVDLNLSRQYEHLGIVEFRELPRIIGGFDVGIAPLADIPVSWARSDIKVKEYAASGVPWLASPVGPYVGLGEDHGGRLVPDDGWFEALERLVTRGRERRRLARKARRWARGQTVDAMAERWESVFAAAAAAARAVPEPVRR